MRRFGRPAITQAMRREVAERYGCDDGETAWITCAYCDDPILIDRTNPKRVRFFDDQGRYRPELDHVEPLYWGGVHNADNLVPACMRCNRSKGPRRLVGPTKPTRITLEELRAALDKARTGVKL